MQFVRNVVDDLVEKRLWPLALGLLVLLIAVPVVLGSGGGDAGDAPAPVPVTTTDAGPLGAGAASAVTAQAATTKRQDRRGKVRDPFKVLYAAKGDAADAATKAKQLAADVAKTAASTASTAAGAATTGSGTPAVDVDKNATKKATKPPSDEKSTKPDPQDTYRINFRFGPVGRTKLRKDVARLTPFPSENRPYLIFLGLLSDKKTAVFLLSSDVTANGEGACRPSKTTCETVELNVGEAELLDIAMEGGNPVQYELEVQSIDAGKASTKAVAAKAHKRLNRRGRTIVQAARLIARAAQKVTRANAYRYDSRLGVLRREDPEKALGAHLPPVPAP